MNVRLIKLAVLVGTCVIAGCCGDLREKHRAKQPAKPCPITLVLNQTDTAIEIQVGYEIRIQERGIREVRDCEVAYYQFTLQPDEIWDSRSWQPGDVWDGPKVYDESSWFRWRVAGPPEHAWSPYSAPNVWNEPTQITIEGLTKTGFIARHSVIEDL